MSTTTEPALDPWADGALKTADAMAFTTHGRREFFRVARERGWPRRYRGKTTIWPKRVLVEYLANLPASRGKGAQS